jgi:hypothetical protein
MINGGGSFLEAGGWTMEAEVRLEAEGYRSILSYFPIFL